MWAKIKAEHVITAIFTAGEMSCARHVLITLHADLLYLLGQMLREKERKEHNNVSIIAQCADILCVVNR